MSERKQRTPAEIIAETEAKLSRLRVKAAKQGAMSNPAITPLVAELTTLRIDIREAKKGLGSGPQSFDARVRKHEFWIAKIEGERRNAEHTLSEALVRKGEIDTAINQAVNNLVTDGNAEMTATA